MPGYNDTTAEHDLDTPNLEYLVNHDDRDGDTEVYSLVLAPIGLSPDSGFETVSAGRISLAEAYSLAGESRVEYHYVQAVEDRSTDSTPLWEVTFVLVHPDHTRSCRGSHSPECSCGATPSTSTTTR